MSLETVAKLKAVARRARTGEAVAEVPSFRCMKRLPHLI